MKNQMTNGALHVFVKASRGPMTALDESGDWIGFPRNPLGIHKREPLFNTGWTAPLTPSCHFLRRQFEFQDLKRSGWAILFRTLGPDEDGPEPVEFFGGWAPLDQAAQVDEWVARLNAEIRARLAAKGKTALRLVGGYREMGYADATAPSLVDSRGNRGPDHKNDVLSYLRAGESVSLSPGPAPDFFDPRKNAGMKSHSLRTDGVYVWPEFLAYYLEHYDVELPSEFEDHMRRREWRMPASIDLKNVKLPWQ